MSFKIGDQVRVVDLPSKFYGKSGPVVALVDFGYDEGIQVSLDGASFDPVFWSDALEPAWTPGFNLNDRVKVVVEGPTKGLTGMVTGVLNDSGDFMFRVSIGGQPAWYWADELVKVASA